MSYSTSRAFRKSTPNVGNHDSKAKDDTMADHYRSPSRIASSSIKLSHIDHIYQWILHCIRLTTAGWDGIRLITYDGARDMPLNSERY
jgi:hypothetical protein